MTSLTTLSLWGNSLSGPVPLSIRRLTQLIELDLSHNNFSGVITGKHLSKMTNLETVDLSSSSLRLIINTNWLPPFKLRSADFSSCRLGPNFPKWLKWQTHISDLDISNTSIADKVPVWFWHVFSKTSILDVSNNNLSGQLPKTLEYMSASRINLEYNNFYGSIPRLPKSLYTINLSGNTLSGPLSLNFEDLIQLRVLVLKENSFNGSIPQSLCKLQHLQYLDLSKNSLAGKVPLCLHKNANATHQNLLGFGSSPLSSLSSSIIILNLGYNNLSGRFPLFLKGCSSLVLLALENNNFFGSIPSWVGKKLATLRILSLRYNRFSGPIPSQLSELSQLQVLDLGQNNFCGHIPPSLKTLNQMVRSHNFHQLDMKNVRQNISDADPFWVESEQNLNSIEFGSLKVDTKGLELQYGDGIKYWTSFDLSCNNLTGGIPEDLGLLVGLMNLNLSRNKLSGNIPNNIGSLQLLESLDLSNNELSGIIPSSLAALTFLSYLNLSYNNLSGKVPSGHQLQVLDDPSIYEGNPGLCGFPVLSECTENNMSKHYVSKKEMDDGMVSFYVGASVGFLIGICLVYGAIFKETWRVAYFRCFDNLYDRVYVCMFVNWAKFTRN
ncbi:hypothetical protein LUZ63_008381 [Rhynchospora breviuscula]|uniref:Uncharacterized protein n=1 Tax=Rhynchospora breviuscula TaxID=2022672 RepID=A0A9Q0HVB2_9POAL|nr:hypothetical protein LUZ63_008381 [Rhynchospora breviuscula]